MIGPAEIEALENHPEDFSPKKHDLDWDECSITGFEMCTVSGVTYWCGDDGIPGKPVFGAVTVLGENINLYRGNNLKSARDACQEHLEGLNK